MKKRLLNGVIRYLGFCARRVIKRAPSDTVIVGVTGSTGKTSTKEAIGLVAKHIWRHDAVISPGNLNNEIGLPLAIMDYQDVPTPMQYPFLLVSALLRALFLKPAKCYVLEYAIDSPGDMKILTNIAKANWAVLTNISSVHLENFTQKKELVEEKLLLAESMPTGGSIIVNGDDEILKKRVKNGKKFSLYSFGKDNSNIAKISAVKIGMNATTFSFQMDSVKKVYKINALGAHYVASVIPAIIFGLKQNLSPETIQRILLDFKPLSGRGNVINGINSSVIVNDTYNANPLSVMASLDLIKQMKAKNKIAVLGDMLELGEESEASHHKILKAASQVADVVITIGPRMHKAGGGNINFTSPDEAARYLKDNIERDSLVLIKGSQSMRTEIIAKAIMANPEIADEVLPRQSAAWLKKPFVEV